jgi:hypothetical protein
MSEERQREVRYQAKAARQPLRFWWQPFFLLGVVVALWSQLPVSAVLFEPRTVPPLHEPRAAYVVLDAAYAAQAFKKSLTAWTLGGLDGRLKSGLELEGVELSEAPPKPEYLQQGTRYPGRWEPSAVAPLPQRLPAVRVPTAAGSPPAAVASASAESVRVSQTPELAAAGFAWPVDEDRPPERSGRCRFYVETSVGGEVEHVLLLSARSLGAAIFERSLLKGRAAGAARGFVEIDWHFAK